MLIPRPGLAQGYRQYLALLDGYASGEATEAATALAAWSDDRVRAAVRALERELLTVADGEGLVRTAVMLHTEAAFVEDADGRESFHLKVARSLVARLLGNPRVGPAVRDFAARWHAQAAAQYCIRNDPLRARLEVNRGLTIDRNHPYVNLVAGALVEYGVVQEEPNPRGTWNIDGQRAYNLKNRLHQAALTYRGIIPIIPIFTRRGCGSAGCWPSTIPSTTGGSSSKWSPPGRLAQTCRTWPTCSLGRWTNEPIDRPKPHAHTKRRARQALSSRRSSR